MDDKSILIKTSTAVEKLPTNEVVSVQREGRKIRIVSDEKNYIYYQKMENVEKKLPDNFYRCHGGCYINLDKVRLMEEQEVFFYNGYSIYLGRSNFIKAKQQFYKYALEND